VWPPPSVAVKVNGSTRLCTGSSVMLSTGGAGNAAQFRDNLDGIQEPSYSSFSKTSINGTSITLSAWIYPTAWKDNYWDNTIISNESFSTQGYSLRCGDNGELNFSLGDGTQWYQLTTAQNALSLNTWQHVAATYDGNTMTLYINGVMVAAQTVSMSIVSASKLIIGNYIGFDRGFSGSLDEVQVWKATLTPTQIQDCMSGNTYALSPGLVAYLKMDADFSAIIAYDETGNVFLYNCQQITSTAPVDNYATFLWSDGETTPSITVNKGGSYAVNVTDASGCSTTSDSTHVIADSIQGNPSVFGDNTWNFYFWNSSGYNIDKGSGAIDPGDSWNSNYAGYYSDTTLSFNTANQWSPTGAPSDATGYHGCAVATNVHSWSAKRKGFPCGYYKLDISNFAPGNYVELYVNDTLVFHGLSSNSDSAWSGWLSSNDSIEYRAAEFPNQNNDYGSINFNASIISITASVPLCSGSTTQLIASYYPGVNYSWSNGATSDTITVANSGTYSVSMTNFAACTASYTVQQVTPPNISMNDTSVCQGSSVTLQAGGNAFDYFFTPVNHNLIQHAPLDNIQGTFLAVGLHKLISSYNGPCMRLIRIGDNAEKDFGFTGDSLDIKSIISWLGGTGGYCKTLYDQSGNGHDFTGSYNGSFYPFFVAFDLVNGNTVIRLVPNTTLYNGTNFPSQFTIIYGSQLNGQYQQALSDGVNNWYLGYSNGAKHQAYFNGWVTPSNNTPAADDSFYVYTGSYNGTNARAYENGTLIGNTNGNFQAPLDLFVNSLSHQSDVSFTDLVIFSRVIADAERQTVENAIINYKQEASKYGQFTIHLDTTTRYNLTGTDEVGCTTTKMVTVTVNPSRVYYRDADGDGYGSRKDSVRACSKPAGYVTNNKDCDDTNPSVHTGCASLPPAISIDDKSFKEGNRNEKNINFNVKLNKKSTSTINVNYATKNGTATAGVDYVAVNGTASFIPGITKIQISVPVIGDKTVEPDETFYIVLSNPVNASIADDSATAIILNDDGSSALSSADETDADDANASTLNNDFLAAPNPASSMVKISLTNYTGNVTIRLSDMQGRVLQEKKVQSSMAKLNQTTLDVSHYANGIYFITVFDDKGKKNTQKLIIER